MKDPKKTAKERAKLMIAGWCHSNRYRGMWYKWEVYNQCRPVGQRREYFTRADALKQIKENKKAGKK